MEINLALAILIIAITNVAPSSASLVTFVFGDSLAEVGNNNYLQLSLAKSNFPFYGIDFAGGKATGRFTNGRTFGDIISAKLGIPSPPSYLSISEDNDALLNGANYASGGAGILNETGLYFIHISPNVSIVIEPEDVSIQTLSFEDQINKFQMTKESIKAKIGEGLANKLCNEAVYIIGIGSNDYVNNFLQPYLADSLQYTHDEFVELLISTLDEQLTRLHQLGARKMVFHGLGPLGCIPAQRAKSSKGECLSQVNLWVQQFNSKVQKLIVNLNSHYYPSAQIKFADTYPVVLDLIEKPTAYGFKVSNTSCCNVDSRVGGLCLPNSKLCDNHSEYVFWDAFHPSDAANVVLADHFFNVVFSNSPSPIPLPLHLQFLVKLTHFCRYIISTQKYFQKKL